MKRPLLWILSLALVLTACGKPAGGTSGSEHTPTWQEQYDLGVRYLSEGKYQEAILAFTAAIEIDPRRAEAYVERGGAYVQLGGTEENLSAAQADYEKAMELDSASAAAYLGLAEVYLQRGDTERAMEILRQGLEQTGENQNLANMLSQLEFGGDGGDTGDPNAGGTGFASYQWYRDFNSLTSGEQAVVEAAVSAARSQDLEALEGLIDRSEVFASVVPEYRAVELATICDGYKLRLSINEGELPGVEGDLTRSVNVELRPENGTGYYLSIYSVSPLRTQGRDHWWDYYETREVITCPCAGWQWNGTVHLTDESRSRWHSAEGSIMESSGHWETTGTMVNSLRDGVFTRAGHSEHWDSFQGGQSWTDDDTHTERYEMGYRVEENGAASEPFGICGLIGSAYAGTLEDVWIQQELYW